jgi:hypothetical protein|tara:strand:+ start:690 stop:1058 length:369 start_codon:yes stop_codon:yes gene_type:complete
VRVRISYSAHIDEVPEEIEQMFTYVSSKSRKILRQIEQLESLLADEDIEATAAIVDRLRLSLSEVDLRLADVQHISAGYLDYKANEGVEDVSEGRPGVATAEDASASPTAQRAEGVSNNGEA